MHGGGKSDGPVVPANLPNKAAAAEVGEERGSAKGNTASKTPPGHSAGYEASSALERVREVAGRDKDARFTALLHHVDLKLLWRSYWAINPKAAPGVDEVTWTEYGLNLEARLRDLHARVQQGRYRFSPARRVYIVRRAALRCIPCAAGKELGGRFLGLMAYPKPKGGRDRSMPLKPWPGGDIEREHGETRVIRQKLDCLKSNLRSVNTRTRRKDV